MFLSFADCFVSDFLLLYQLWSSYTKRFSLDLLLEKLIVGKIKRNRRKSDIFCILLAKLEGLVVGIRSIPLDPFILSNFFFFFLESSPNQIIVMCSYVLQIRGNWIISSSNKRLYNIRFFNNNNNNSLLSKNKNFPRTPWKYSL